MSEAAAGGSARDRPPLVLDRTSLLQLAILVSTNFVAQLAIGMIIVILPVYAQALGLGAAGVGLLVALPQLSKLLFNLPAGHYVDVLGRKPLLIAGTLIDAVGQLGTGLAGSVALLAPK